VTPAGRPPAPSSRRAPTGRSAAPPIDTPVDAPDADPADRRTSDGRSPSTRAGDGRAGGRSATASATRERPPRSRPTGDRVARDDGYRRDGRRPSPAELARAYRRRGLRRLAVLVLTVFGVLAVAYLVLFSSVFGARSVEVTGTALLTADEVRAAAAVPPGTPLLRLDVDAVVAGVGGLAPVAAVEVVRSWPSTVTVRVTERVPVAYAVVPEGSRLIDREGVEFATVAAPPPGVPELRAGNADATRSAAAVLDTLAQPGRELLRAAVALVQAATPFDVQLALVDGRTVRWGSTDESDRKAAVLTVLLSQPGTVYDVASPDLPTIR